MYQPQLKFEVAFGTTDPFSASPTWTDISDRLLAVRWERGRQRQIEQPTPGSGQVTLDNSDRALEELYASSPYYPNVTTGLRCRLTATVPGHAAQPCFVMYVDRFAPQWELPVDQVAVWDLVDALNLFGNWPITGLFPQATVGARLNAILNSVNWPAADRNITVTGRTLPSRNLTGLGGSIGGTDLTKTTFHEKACVLPFLVACADSQPVSVYIDAQGRVSAGGLLGNAGGGGSFTLGSGGVDYEAAEPTIDESTVITCAAVTRDPNSSTDTPATKVAQLTGTRHGFRLESRTIYGMTDTDSSDVASTLLNTFKQPFETFDPVSIKPIKDSDFLAVLGYDMGQSGTINRSSDNGSYASTGVIHHVTHEVVKRESWQTELRLTARQVP